VSYAAVAVLTAAVFALLFRHELFATRPAPVALQAIAALLMLWARLAFGLRSFHAGADPASGVLITKGPYRWVRHPIYTAILLFVWTGALSHAGGVSVLMAAVASGAIAARIGAEEPLLAERFPEYAAYAARTKRVIPLVF